MPYQIYGDEPMLQIHIEGKEVYSATMRYIQADKREWYAQHLETAFARQQNKAFNNGRQNAQAEVRHALGLGG